MTEAQCRAIQNYGEQHPQFHSVEMKEWRKRDAKESYTSILDRIDAKTDKRPEQFLELLEERAKEISPDYPFEGSNAFDWLWAIVSSYTGTHQANQECHAFRLLVSSQRKEQVKETYIPGMEGDY